jgi:hypothetical protein
LKGLYYFRTTAGATGDKVATKVVRDALKDFESEATDECLSCQG